MNSSGKVLVALFSGIAAGLLIGVLVAPEKGSEIRKRILNKATDLADKAKTAASETVDKLREVANAVGGTHHNAETEEFE